MNLSAKALENRLSEGLCAAAPPPAAPVPPAPTANAGLTLNCMLYVLTDLYKHTTLLRLPVTLSYTPGQEDDSKSRAIVYGIEGVNDVHILKGKDYDDFEPWNAKEPYLDLRLLAGQSDYGPDYRPFGVAFEAKFVDRASGRNFNSYTRIASEGAAQELFIQHSVNDSLEKDKIEHSGLYFKGVCKRPDVPDHE